MRVNLADMPARFTKDNPLLVLLEYKEYEVAQGSQRHIEKRACVILKPYAFGLFFVTVPEIFARIPEIEFNSIFLAAYNRLSAQF